MSHSHSHFPPDLVVEFPGYYKKEREMRVLLYIQDSQQLMEGHVLLPAKEQRGQKKKLSPARCSPPPPPPGEVRVTAGGWAEPRLAPPHETPGIAGIWGSQRHHLLSACVMAAV